MGADDVFRFDMTEIHCTSEHEVYPNGQQLTQKQGFPRVLTAGTYAQPAPPHGAAQRKKISPRVLNSGPNLLTALQLYQMVNPHEHTSILKPPSRQAAQNQEPLSPQTFPCPIAAQPTPCRPQTSLPRWLPPQPLRPPPTSLSPSIVFGHHALYRWVAVSASTIYSLVRLG